MAKLEPVVEIRHAWWLQHYIIALVLIAALMGCEPDWQKLQNVIMRAMRWRFVGARKWQAF